MLSLVQTFAVSFVLMLDASSELREAERVRLNACMEKITVNPEEAYEDGLVWLSEANRPRARHCTAMALFELGHYEEAAARLESLANASDGGTIEERAVYLAQAGNAWLIASRFEAAELTLTNAIRLTPNDYQLYKDRARARFMQEKWLAADADASEALSYNQNDVEALKIRIKSRFELGELEMALKDVKVARVLAPTDVDVLVLRGEVRDAIRKKEELE